MRQKFCQNPKRIVLISSGHGVMDDLIYHRYAKTLAAAGFEVSIMAVKDHIYETENIDFIQLKRHKSRLVRFIFTNFSILLHCLRIKERGIFMLFTPDLLPIGLLLKLFLHKKVIYCALENYRLKILNKQWIPRILRKPVSFLVHHMEEAIAGFLSLTIFVDTSTAAFFPKLKNKIVLPNYPKLNDNVVLNKEVKRENSTLRMVYIGSISEERGLKIYKEIADSTDIECEIHLYGPLASEDYSTYFENQKRLIYHGVIPWNKVLREITLYDIGLCLFEPVPAYLHSAENTTKLYEYMLAGLPVLASDFKGLRRIIEAVDCGICVNPKDIDEIVKAAKYISQNTEKRKQWSINGIRAVQEHLNWNKESKRLIDAIDRL